MNCDEKSCGAVVFCRTAQGVRYLLVRGHGGFWSFPKGHMEAGETERETTLREIREETGLTVRLLDGFRTADRHSLAREGFPDRIKETVYFLGLYDGGPVTPQPEEIAEAALMDDEAAMAALAYAGFRRVLAAARAFLADEMPEPAENPS